MIESIRNRHCHRCPLASQATNVCIVGNGPPLSQIMIVGEAPGAEEDKAATPFVGRSGKLLNGCLEEVGLSRDLVYVTNLTKCRPPGNRTPTPTEWSACYTYLQEEMKVVEPFGIMLLGRTALEGFATMYGLEYWDEIADLPMGKLRGEWLGYNPDVMATWHPSYALRQPSARQDIVADLRMFLRRVEEHFDKSDPNFFATSLG